MLLPVPNWAHLVPEICFSIFLAYILASFNLFRERQRVCFVLVSEATKRQFRQIKIQKLFHTWSPLGQRVYIFLFKVSLAAFWHYEAQALTFAVDLCLLKLFACQANESIHSIKPRCGGCGLHLLSMSEEKFPGRHRLAVHQKADTKRQRGHLHAPSHLQLIH